MTRLAALERVLAAARAVVEARDDQMLTQLEWDALAAAVRGTDDDTPPASKPPVQIVFEDGLMMVLDAENQGYDCLDLDSCPLDVAGADRRLGQPLRIRRRGGQRGLPNIYLEL